MGYFPSAATLKGSLPSASYHAAEFGLGCSTFGAGVKLLHRPTNAPQELGETGELVLDFTGAEGKRCGLVCVASRGGQHIF